MAYRGTTLDNGATVPVLTESPKISKNYSELQAFASDSRKAGDMAVIGATSPVSSAFPLEALQHYRLVHESETPVTSDGQKRVKTFEHVPGAVIEGNAPAGTVVLAGVAIMSNENRAFVYRQSNVTDAGGKFTLVLPYSTEGPIASGTNFDTKPLGPYQISAGGKTYEVRVPEEYVLKGSVITI